MEDPKSKKGARQNVGAGLPQGFRAPAKGESSSSDVRPMDDGATLAENSSPPPADPGARIADADLTLADKRPAKPPSGRRPSSVSPKEAVLETGDLIGDRYEILQLLGEGGMGAVYKAIDREVDRFVALKLIRPELASNPAILARFKQELLTAHQVTHKNVIRIYDIGEADGVKFITMEFIEGSDLRRILLDNGKLLPDRAVEIIRQVCLALEAAHSAGIIHRDLKPQNIMQDKQDRILVMDFGLARSIESEGMTQSGALLGTIEYMSPEQSMGKKLDHRSDIFALGLIFYELLTGKTPYKADTAMASLLLRSQERALPAAELDTSIPRGVSDIVSKCLDRDLNSRYQNVQEILSDLDAWQGKRPLLASIPATVQAPKPSVPWKWVAAFSLTVVMAAAGWLIREKLTSATSVKPAKGPEVSLAILPFRNGSGDPGLDWLGPSLADMLSTDVGQSAHLRTITPDRLHQVLADLRITPGTAIDPTMVDRIAEFSNADTVVWGQYAKFGDQIRIDATLLDLKHNRRAPLKIEASSEKDILGSIDKLADLIRQNLSIASDALKELKASSFKPTSSSIAALREFNQGVQLLRDGKNIEAVKALQAAIHEDSKFALAYARLAEADSELGYDNDAEQISRKALDLSQELPAAEKYLIEASHARIVKDHKKAIQAYENLSKILPDDTDVQYALSGLYRDQAEFDKSRALLSKILQVDPKNSRALWQMGVVEISNSNPQAALDPLNRGVSVAVQVDNQEQKALILLALGVAYKGLNKPEEALRNYQQSLEINERIGQKRAAATALNNMAQLQAQMGKNDLALTSFNRALQIRREIGAKKEQGDTLIDLGNLYLDRGQQDQALQMYKDSLKIQRDAGDETYQALCLNNIGNLYLNRNDSEDALTYLQQALQLRQKLNAPAAIAETVQNLGIAYANMGQDDEAMSDFMQALDLYRKAGNNHGAALQSHNMAFVFERQGRYGAAINAMQSALKTLHDEGDRSAEMVQALSDFAEFLGEAGRGGEVSQPLEEAQAAAHDLKNDALEAAILNTRGDLLYYAGDPKGAKALYAQATQAATRGGQPDELLISKMNLAKAALAEGHLPPQNAELTRLAQQADKLGLRPLSVECTMYLAQTVLNAKDYSRARQLLEQTLGRSEKLGLRMLSVRIRYLLGTSLRLSGQVAEATNHYGEVIRLLDEMKKDAGADHLLDRSDLQSIYAEATRWRGSAKSD